MRLISQRSAKRTLAMTLTQTLVAVGVGSLVLTSIALVWVSASWSFAALDNYISMDRSSRSTLDQMTRDMREARDLTSFATNQVVFSSSGTSLGYSWDPASGTLSRWTSAGDTNTLLTGCGWLQFTMYQNVPQTNGTFLIATNTSQAKSVTVAWKCSRTILGKKLNTEDVQEAQIVIRSKPVS